MVGNIELRLLSEVRSLTRGRLARSHQDQAGSGLRISSYPVPAAAKSGWARSVPLRGLRGQLEGGQSVGRREHAGGGAGGNACLGGACDRWGPYGSESASPPRAGGRRAGRTQHLLRAPARQRDRDRGGAHVAGPATRRDRRDTRPDAGRVDDLRSGRDVRRRCAHADLPHQRSTGVRLPTGPLAGSHRAVREQRRLRQGAFGRQPLPGAEAHPDPRRAGARRDPAHRSDRGRQA